MGDFVNGFISKLFSVLLSMLVIAVNTYFVISYVIKLNISNPVFILFVVIIGIIYLLFCFYLTVDMVSITLITTNKFLMYLSVQMLAMGSTHLASLPLVRRIFSTTVANNNYAIHEEDGQESEMEQVDE